MESLTIQGLAGVLGIQSWTARKLVDELNPPVERVSGRRVVPADRLPELAELMKSHGLTKNDGDAEGPKFLTPPVVANMLDVDPAKVIAWIRRGELVAVNLAERPNGQRPRYRIDRSELDAFLKRRATRNVRPPQQRRRAAAVVGGPY